jgi:hypothetical protein
MANATGTDPRRQLRYQLARACDALDHVLITLDRVTQLDPPEMEEVTSDLDVIKAKIRTAESMVHSQATTGT